jgi:restriction system protein
MTNSKGGYKSLIVYWLATDIYDLTVLFCSRYIDKRSRTQDQMVQEARSGKQNIVEGSLEPSVESNIKLTGVARASFGELLEDYKDYVRQNKLSLWAKNDPRVMQIRQMHIVPYETHMTHKTYESHVKVPENFSNLMVTLCFKEGFLLDKLLRSQQEQFIKVGGFRENLFKKRIDYKNKF